MKLCLVFIVFLFFALLGFFPASKLYAAQTDPSFNFTFEGQKFPVSKEGLASWQGQEALAPSNILASTAEPLKTSLLTSIGQTAVEPDTVRTYHYRLHDIYTFVRGLAEKIDAPTMEPSLTIKAGRAADFTPPQNGLQLDAYKTSLLAQDSLELGKTESAMSVYQTNPKNSLSETNNLGINELVSEGVSNFRGSPKNRRFNIAKGVEKFKGIIVAQGEEFSFNKNLGPVDAESGFLPELVIKKEGTIPEFGGGLCQVSTTTFRAAMEAGLPITARRNHAYAVQYYSPQGTDATIYPGSSDLKFINDTPSAILIWPYEKDANTLIFDFYGSKDSRQVVLDKPVQYDRKADGSMKATWTRHVTKDGENRDDVFKSVYQSPALFHKQEQFVGASTTVSSNLTPTSNSTPKPLQ